MAAGVRSVAAAGVPSPARVALRDPGPARGDGGPDGGGAPDPARGDGYPDGGGEPDPANYCYYFVNNLHVYQTMFSTPLNFIVCPRNNVFVHVLYKHINVVVTEPSYYKWYEERNILLFI